MYFSVLMSVYKNDDPNHLKLAYESISEKQIVKPNEIILVVDGPIGNDLKETIKSFNDNYLKVFYLEKNVGLGKALNYGLEKTSYDIVARMDSDDVSCSHRFYEQIKEFKENKKLVLMGGHIEEFGSGIKRIRKVPLSHKSIMNFVPKRNPFNHMTVMFKKSAVVSAGGYLHMPFYEDYYLWHRILNNNLGEVRNIDKILVEARVDNGLISRRHGLEMFKNEMFFYLKLLKEKYISFFQFLIYGIPRILVRIIPSRIFNFIYSKFLRN